MNFRERIPSEILRNPPVDKFVTVLDETNTYKQQEMQKAFRFYRSPLNTNLKFLIKRLEDEGFPPIPADFPKDVLDALLLNYEDINALRGSRQGLELWLWCLTFGAITIDDSAFMPVNQFIMLSSPTNGFLSRFSPNVVTTPGAPDLFLFDDISQFGTSILIVDIVTKYDTNTSIINYINTHIKKYLTFVTSSATITVNFTNGPYVTNTFPHQYFVLP